MPLRQACTAVFSRSSVPLCKLRATPVLWESRAALVALPQPGTAGTPAVPTQSRSRSCGDHEPTVRWEPRPLCRSRSPVPLQEPREAASLQELCAALGALYRPSTMGAPATPSQSGSRSRGNPGPTRKWELWRPPCTPRVCCHFGNPALSPRSRSLLPLWEPWAAVGAPRRSGTAGALATSSHSASRSLSHPEPTRNWEPTTAPALEVSSAALGNQRRPCAPGAPCCSGCPMPPWRYRSPSHPEPIGK